MNRIFMVGRLTKDPEVRVTQTQKKVASFSIAINAGKDKTPDYVNCTAWEKTAEILQNYTGKGSQIAIDGQFKTDSYEKDGKKVYKSYVLVKSLELIGSKTDRQSTPVAQNASPQQELPNIDVDEINMPF